VTTPQNAADDSPFWRFSLRFYGQPQVARACLVLQDEAGADVNLMLLLLFLAQSRRVVTREEIVRVDGLIRAWRDDVVKPLRGLRRRLKEGVDGLPATTNEPFRNKIKQVELEAERIEQHWLEREAGSGAFGAAPSRAAAARANLMA
jgi:uncharacterized protein (TIGR02444 family)